ncbi:MAG: aminopeptidase P family protein [Spirochaetia bacterium]
MTRSCWIDRKLAGLHYPQATLHCYTPLDMVIRDRLHGLRDVMTERGIDAYVIPSSDPHQSVYPPEHWRSRAWITGFDGSAGTAVVTADRAGLWTDFRYYLHAEKALAGTGIELFRSGEPGVLEYPQWLADELPSGARVGFDGMCVSLSATRDLNSALRGKNIRVESTADLLESIWPDRPPLPKSPIHEYDPRYSGASRGEKLSAIRARMQEIGVEYHVNSTLDDIAWLLNLRGADVIYLPVAVCHAIVSSTDVRLFIDVEKVGPDVASALEADGVTLRPYEDFLDAIGLLAGSVLLSPSQVSAAVAERIPEAVSRVEQRNLTTTAKARKNSTELEHIRQVMIRDGVAMVRYLHWLTGAIATEDVTELSSEMKLEEFRALGERFVSPSFRTISAYRGHGAIPHYTATDDSDSLLEPAGLYLVDSGAQYLDGTTDITRTISLGAPTDEERKDYTLVLKGHIALATLRFPVGTTGPLIDAVARQFLWRERMNYGHGTGHGVGFFLSVHEGPQQINQKKSDVKLEPGMLISNEPGVYRAGRHGVRIENLVVVAEPTRSDFGEFLEFETVTLCPFDGSLVDTSLLTAEEIEWVNEYHRRVRDKLLGHLVGAPGEWLEEACRPLVV